MTVPATGARFDLSGQRFNGLLVLEYAGRCASGYTYKCRCDCGDVKIVSAAHLRSGHTKSCGCLNRRKPPRRIHGDTCENGRPMKTPEYMCWLNMRTRCNYPNFIGFSDYGGRGIKVCERWEHGDGGRTGFECFLADMGRRPSPKHSIDRYPDNDGNYEPGNCRWATRAEQAANRRPQKPYHRNGAMVRPRANPEACNGKI